jgi:hypothetical protein
LTPAAIEAEAAGLVTVPGEIARRLKRRRLAAKVLLAAQDAAGYRHTAAGTVHPRVFAFSCRDLRCGNSIEHDVWALPLILQIFQSTQDVLR